MFPDRIETNRLVLERFCRENLDMENLHRIYSNAEDVFRYQTWESHETLNETYELVDDLETRWENRARASYIIRPASSESGSGEFAGDTGIDIDWERRRGDLGIWLRKKFWGREYSNERATALMELAFEKLGLEIVTARCVDGNENARRAIEKYVTNFGGRYDGLLRNEATIGGDVFDVHQFSVSIDEFSESN